MRELEGQTAEETASLLGLTVANVKSRLHRARALVRAALDAAFCGP
jgi:DNA-directed RNA polymerase specialized sigma24 family protein